MNEEARKILIRYWGYDSFRPLQEEIIESVLAGNDTLALLPTGGGKSLCFQVPAMMLPGTCIVITPLIALMNDQVANLKKIGITARAIHTGLHRNEIEAVYSNCVNGKLKFLYVSPERLENEVFINVLHRMKVSFITVDEAHCISQWGYDFRPPYLKISDIRLFLEHIPFLALTATATPVVAEDIMHKLKFKNPHFYKSSFERRNLAYSVYKESDKSGKILSLLKQGYGTAIVYVRNRRKTREISEVLQKNNISSSFYHAGLDAKTRDERQKDWTSGKIRVIVSTNAFGMGIDKPDVRQVIHYDLPDSIESYFQEAGRAGRDLKPSFASLLADNHDIVNAKRKFKESYPPLERIRIIYNCLGNYFQLPEGSGQDIGFDFNIVEFSSQYEFNLMEVYNTIKFLEREGFIVYNESAGQYSRLFIPLTKEDLYRFLVDNPGTDHLLKEILRSYAGVFTEYININESQLAKRAEMNKDDLIKKLNYLSKNGILNYIPIKSKPQLIYVTERLNDNHIRFSKENYDNLKDAAEKRLQSLLDFLTNSLQCRSQQLLAYFGEKQSKRCGICDVCLQKNKTDLNKIEFDGIRQMIKEKLQNGPVHLNNLISSIVGFSEEDVIAVLRWLLENKQIVRLKDEKLKWHDQLNLSFD